MTKHERSETAYDRSAENRKDVVVTLRISPELNEKTAMASKAVGLKRADIMRLALDRGVERLLEQLEGTGA
jgi:predicted DNA-binding protein